MNRYLHHAAFFAGLAAACWVGAGYVAANPLALAITVLIVAFYLMGALELRRYHQATSSLERALADMKAPPSNLGQWLEHLHPSLQNAVRLRVEGERVALPGPALTPYLAGLLVLLGMLGTFLGMVVALKGTGMALESATDLQSIRSSLSAPVKGLGLAFGTSVAGVCASSMLGLMSALCRRERLQAAQMLDARIATSLRVFSLTHQREESFKLLQRQAEAMPDLVDRLQSMMATMERQSQALDTRLIANQESFHGKAETAYVKLAASIDRSLKASLAESVRVAGAAIQPVVEATMVGIARDTATLHDTIARAVEHRLDGLSAGFAATTTGVADIWKTALAEHQHANQAWSKDVGASLGHFAETFEQRSASLLRDVSDRLESTTDSVSQTWRGALAQHERLSANLSSDAQQALAASAATFERTSASLLSTVHKAHAHLQEEMATREQQRLEAWTQGMEAMALSLRQEWQQAGALTLARQQQICDTLAHTARDISAQTDAHAKSTITEIAQLVQAAAQAPRAAAEVIAEMRSRLSDGMARDNAVLEERSRILESMGTLLATVNQASTEQRTSIDALVATSADLLDRLGTQFTEKLEAESEKMASVAAQITGSAVEVASLGEAFGLAVQLFSQSNDKLVAHLQRIEAALSKSTARSDEQLAYYVAQAREVIDLSMMSQKQMVEDMQKIANTRALVGSDVS